MNSTRRIVLSLVCAGALLPACSDDPAPTDAAVDAPDAAPTDTPVADASDVQSPRDVTSQDVVAQDVSSTDVAADAPVRDAPVADAPSDVPTADAAVDAPVADAAADVPAADAPAVDAPAVDVPLADVPAVDVPAADVPASTDAGADAAVPPDAGPGTPFVATLNGAQEVPLVTTAASGTAMITLNAARTSVSYTITTTATSITAMHFHIGMAGENGPVSITIPERGATITGSATITSEQADAIEQGRAYINVHTTAFGGGEIRGQVVRPGEETFVAALSRDQEVPATTSTSTGLANVFVNSLGMYARYRVRTDIAAPTAAHIHGASAGVNGGVVFAFGTPVIASGVTTYAGTQMSLTPVSVADAAAGRWYVNVHTAANPGGELRGQVLRPGERLYVTQLSGANEVPPVTTSAAATVSVIVSGDQQRISYTGSFTGLTPTLAHLHNAAAGSNGPVVFNILSAGAIGGSADTGAGTGLSAGAFLAALEAGTIYANIHTAANPGGELRGQLARRPAP